MKTKSQIAETVGAGLGMLGAFLAAAGFGLYGYPAFTLSSLILCYTASVQKNINLMLMQGAFLLANAIGIYTFVLR